MLSRWHGQESRRHSPARSEAQTLIPHPCRDQWGPRSGSKFPIWRYPEAEPYGIPLNVAATCKLATAGTPRTFEPYDVLPCFPPEIYWCNRRAKGVKVVRDAENTWFVERFVMDCPFRDAKSSLDGKYIRTAQSRNGPRTSWYCNAQKTRPLPTSWRLCSWISFSIARTASSEISTNSTPTPTPGRQ